ncbi:MAG: hypothetical protein U5N86_12305 [Planctomycetota bacterium]|nr:hypothetical protein [Planctomycetota bacterium]
MMNARFFALLLCTAGLLTLSSGCVRTYQNVTLSQQKLAGDDNISFDNARILVESDISFSDGSQVRFTNCIIEFRGASVVASNSTLELTNCAVRYSGDMEAVVKVTGGSVKVFGSSFKAKNQSKSAVFACDGGSDVHIVGCRFTSVSQALSGEVGNLIISSSEFSRCDTNDAELFDVKGKECSISACEFNDIVSENTHVLSLWFDKVTLTGCVVSHVEGTGMFVTIDADSFSARGNSFFQNNSELLNVGATSILLAGNSFVNCLENILYAHGRWWSDKTIEVVIVGNAFERNQDQLLFYSDATSTIRNNTFVNNIAGFMFDVDSNAYYELCEGGNYISGNQAWACFRVSKKQGEVLQRKDEHIAEMNDFTLTVYAAYFHRGGSEVGSGYRAADNLQYWQ